MKIDEINSRHMPITQDVPEFADKVSVIDYNIEDFLSLVISLTTILYFINLESVWGALGFTWDEVENYGHFNAVTFTVEHIPLIPDPERIKKFPRNFISQMNDQHVYIDYNDFSNLTEIDYILSNNTKDLTIDTDGINCDLNLLDYAHDLENDAYLGRRVTLIGSKKPAQIIYRIENQVLHNAFSSNQHYLIINDNTKFKFSPYYINAIYKYEGSSERFIIKDQFENIDTGLYNIASMMFESKTNKFTLCPTRLYQFNITYNHDDLTEEDKDDYNVNYYYFDNFVDVTYDLATEPGITTPLYIADNKRICLKNIEFINTDSVLSPIQFDSISYMAFISVLNNVQSIYNFPFQILLNLVKEGKLFSGAAKDKTLILRNWYVEYKPGTSEQIELDITGCNFTITGGRFLMENCEDLELTKQVTLFKFKSDYTSSLIYNQSNAQTSYEDCDNLWDCYKVTTGCMTYFNQDLNTYSLTVGTSHLFVYGLHTYSSYNLNSPINCKVSFRSDIDYTNRYLFYPRFTTITDLYWGGYVSLREVPIDFFSNFYNTVDNTIRYINLTDIDSADFGNIETFYTNGSPIIAASVFSNVSGLSILGNKNNTLKNSDGAIIMFPRGLRNAHSLYVILDITKWDYLYNFSLTFITIQSNIHAFVDAIVDRSVDNGCTISIVHENYIQLAEEEKNKMINLGYTVIDYII